MPGLHPRLRGRVAAVCALATALFVSSAASASDSPGLRTHDYWVLADQIATAFAPTWSTDGGEYRWNGVADVRTNANLLTAHAIAAYEHHVGVARQDAHARAIVAHLTTPPVWRGTGRVHPADGVSHPSTCWATDFAGTWPGHMSLEPKVASALAWAVRARRALGLEPSAVAAIRREVSACARSRAWRYPAAMADQINWYEEMYASAATVTGSGALLRGDYRRQLVRFAAGITHPMHGKRSGNLGPAYEFHYRPDLPASAAINIDAPEYADIVIDAIGHYDRALHAGMRPLPARDMSLMRAWVTRVLAGNWTHAGYLNWDTGHGFGRWHSAQYWAFAQQGLLAIAGAREYWSNPAYGRWAKALFDRGLILYSAIVTQSGGGLQADELFGVQPFFQDANAFHSRVLANVTRAIAQGLGRAPAADPPPLYAYDYDTGRLAISTPSYSTAVVPDNRGAFPYGGIELARLFAAGQRVAANVGGLPPAAFGIVVRRRDGVEALASQRDLPKVPARLRLTQSPRGPSVHPHPYPLHPFAGPFGRVTAVGSLARGPVRITTTHSFGATAITEHWHVAVAPSGGSYSVEAHFPTWGGDDVQIEATLKTGAVVVLAGAHAAHAHPKLADVARITLDTGSRAGYTVVPVSAPAAAEVSIVAAARQTSDPDPGPTLAIVLGDGSGARATDLTVRLVPFTR